MTPSLSPAYVLHSRPYRDSSALVDLLTLHHGLQRVVWRGARGQRRKVSPQPFMPLLVGLGGRSELKTLTQAEIAGRFSLLQGETLFSGLYLNELLVRLLVGGEPQPILFAAYQQSLEQLAAGDPVEPILRRFEWQLLELLGYGFSLTEDAHGQPLDRTGTMPGTPARGCDPCMIRCRAPSGCPAPRCWPWRPTTGARRPPCAPPNS